MRENMHAGGDRAGKLDAGRFVEVISKGGTLAGAARAAGSTATTRAAQKQAGYKLLTRLRERGVIIQAFNEVGLTFQKFAASVAERLEATRQQHWCNTATGDVLDGPVDADNQARAAAAAQYMTAIGLAKVPQEAPSDPDPLSGLSDDELMTLLGEAGANA